MCARRTVRQSGCNLIVSTARRRVLGVWRRGSPGDESGDAGQPRWERPPRRAGARSDRSGRLLAPGRRGDRDWPPRGRASSAPRRCRFDGGRAPRIPGDASAVSHLTAVSPDAPGYLTVGPFGNPTTNVVVNYLPASVPTLCSPKARRRECSHDSRAARARPRPAICRWRGSRRSCRGSARHPAGQVTVTAVRGLCRVAPVGARLPVAGATTSRERAAAM